jgi:hypothetical protein
MTVDVNTRAEIEGDRKGGLALEHQREAATLALQNKPGFDVAAISEEDFERGLVTIKRRQLRLQRILDTVLIEDVLYGNPKDNSGRPVFKKPMLFQAGAEELRTFFRLTPRYLEPMQITETQDFVSVTVNIGLFDNAGRLVGTRSANCNSREKRFERTDKKGYTYTDARETTHSCIAMAEKRALTFVTREATGATGFFSAEEEMEKGLAGENGEPKIEPWTELDKKMVYARAAKIGIKSADEFEKFAKEVLGRDDVRQFIAASEVETLLKAIEARKAGAKPSEPPATERTPADDEYEKRLAQE